MNVGPAMLAVVIGLPPLLLILLLKLTLLGIVTLMLLEGAGVAIDGMDDAMEIEVDVEDVWL